MLAIMVMVLGMVLTSVCTKVGIPIFARMTTAVTIMMGPSVLMMMRIVAAVVATMLIIAVGINDGDCDDRGVRNGNMVPDRRRDVACWQWWRWCRAR